MVDWAKLTAPFEAAQVRQRPGPGNRTLSYVDARVVAQRLDDVLSPEGWYFECEAVPGTEVVRGSLYIRTETSWLVRQDHGYPNSDHDEEPLKAATSDALKRVAVLFGIGRHLYDDNTNGRGPSSPRPAAATARPARTAPSAPPPQAWDDSDLMSDDEPPLPPGAKLYRKEEFPPIVPAKPGDLCAEHGEEWRGEVGDLYHRKAEGGYCRHPGNTKKAGRR